MITQNIRPSLILFSMVLLYLPARGQVKYTELGDRLTLLGAGYSRLAEVNAYNLQIGNTRNGRTAFGLSGSITTLLTTKTLSVFLEAGLIKPNNLAPLGLNLFLAGSLLWYTVKIDYKNTTSSTSAAVIGFEPYVKFEDSWFSPFLQIAYTFVKAGENAGSVSVGVDFVVSDPGPVFIVTPGIVVSEETTAYALQISYVLRHVHE